MGKLEDALEKAGGAGGRGSGGGLGGATTHGGAGLQKGRPGVSAEEQIAGKGTGPDDETNEGGRAMPTSPAASRVIPE